MITNKDIDECLVMSEITAEEYINDALREFYRPDVEMEAAILWAGLPESMKQLLRKRAPEAVKAVERKGE